MQRDPEVLGHVTPQEMEELDDAYIKRKTLELSMLLSILKFCPCTLVGVSETYNKMSFKFGQVSVSSKDFYKRRQITDLFSLDYDKVVVSDPIQCGKDKRYVSGYETSNGITPLYIKTPKNVFGNGVTQYNENSAHTMSFDLDGHQDWLEK